MPVPVSPMAISMQSPSRRVAMVMRPSSLRPVAAMACAALIRMLSERTEAVVEEADVVADVLRRSIDLVGYAGGELADGLELHRLHRLQLEVLALGDVDDEHQQRRGGGRRASQPRQGHAEEALLAV